MADVVSPEVRSRMMSGIRGKNTKPELLVRQGLHAEGFRYRIHDARLPGKPDLVFPKYRAAVFVHGCFWHGHDCHLFRLPTTRPEFWEAKIRGNVERDHRAVEGLRESGWRVGTVWECALKGRTRRPPGEITGLLAKWLRSDAATFAAEGLNHD
jgi:DNA mismatch endonuclease (patch repair protein)